jgi:hypothetical protein
VATPYPDWNNPRLRAYLEALGFEVLNVEGEPGAAASGNQGINDHDPEEVVAFASRVCRPEADALLCSCTAWRSVEAVEELERRTGKPVVSSNQASSPAAYRASGSRRRSPASVGCWRAWPGTSGPTSSAVACSTRAPTAPIRRHSGHWRQHQRDRPPGCRPALGRSTLAACCSTGLINAHTHAHGNLQGMGDRWIELLLTAPWINGNRSAKIDSSARRSASRWSSRAAPPPTISRRPPAPTHEGVESLGRAYADVGMRAVIALIR